MIRLKADGASLRHRIRRREAEAVFHDVPDTCFEEALELGAGDGFQSRQFLARCARTVLCTELNAERLIRQPVANITYEVCDAEDLPFDAGRFDLIFSSNLLEHLLHPERSLSEMHRVLADEGVMVHVIPNRFWKLLHIALFYPSRVVSVAELLLSRDKRSMLGKVEAPGNNLNGKRPSFIERNVWPPVHGEYPNHLAEFARMGASHWNGLFSDGGFQLVGYVGGLPVHSPYRLGMEPPRRLLETIGLSSCHGYVLTKTGQSPHRARLFTGAAA